LSVKASSRTGYPVNFIQILPGYMIIRPDTKCSVSPGYSIYKYIININTDFNLLFQGLNNYDATTFLYEPSLLQINLIKYYLFTVTGYTYPTASAPNYLPDGKLDNWTNTGNVMVLNPGLSCIWGNYNQYPYSTQNILGIQSTGSITTKTNSLNLSSGQYKLSFYAIKRAGGLGPNGIIITLTSTTNTTNTTNTTINASDIKDIWINFTWDITITSPDTYKLKIEGTISGDKTTFIQGVYIIQV
jgi:hypothetical protein